jgi:hypothetical protein
MRAVGLGVAAVAGKNKYPGARRIAGLPIIRAEKISGNTQTFAVKPNV